MDDDDAMNPIWYILIGVALVACGILWAIAAWHVYQVEGKNGIITVRGAEYPIHFVLFLHLIPSIAGIVLIWRGMVLIRQIMQQT